MPEASGTRAKPAVHPKQSGHERKGFLRRLTHKDWFVSLVAFFIVGYVRLVFRTTRWTFQNNAILNHYWDADKPFIAVFWHGRLAMMPFLWQTDKTAHLLISRHGDGAYSTKTMAYFGIEPIYGSRAKEKGNRKKDQGGARALREMAKTLRKGGYVVITPDGPRGPAYEMAPGITTLARLAGAPIIPASYAMKRRRVLNTWDRFNLPLPFNRGVFILGDPIEVTSDADEASLAAKSEDVRVALIGLDRKADHFFGHEPSAPALNAEAPPADIPRDEGQRAAS